MKNQLPLFLRIKIQKSSEDDPFFHHFTVQQIMSENVLSFKIQTSPKRLMESMRSKGFDHALITKNGKHVGYISLKKLEKEQLPRLTEKSLTAFYPNLFISANTPILHLIQLFSRFPKEDFFLVLSLNQICGILTLADLNKTLVRTPLFFYFQEFESTTKTWLEQHFQNNNSEINRILEESFDEANRKSLEKRYEKSRQNKVDISFVQILGFSHIVKLLSHEKSLSLNEILDFLKSSIEKFFLFLEKKNITHPKSQYERKIRKIYREMLERCIKLRNDVVHGNELIPTFRPQEIQSIVRFLRHHTSFLRSKINDKELEINE